jgi:hypothetical protein
MDGADVRLITITTVGGVTPVLRPTGRNPPPAEYTGITTYYHSPPVGICTDEIGRVLRVWGAGVTPALQLGG